MIWSKTQVILTLHLKVLLFSYAAYVAQIKQCIRLSDLDQEKILGFAFHKFQVIKGPGGKLT